MQTKKSICSECNEPYIKLEDELDNPPICESCLDEEKDSDNLWACCGFCTDLCGYQDNDDCDEEDLDFSDSDFRTTEEDCEHLDTYIDNEGFSVCDDCGADLF